jgi:squalene-hopene/tetraprenyl-beta-curcumene cyclase
VWLRQHQYQDGSWWAPSLNGLRQPDSELGRFMSDAATGYAVLAMEQARAQGATASSPAAPADRPPGT